MKEVDEANAARKAHAKSRDLQRKAVKAVARKMARENQAKGHHYTRKQLCSFR